MDNSTLEMDSSSQKLKHSGPGIASFIVSILALVAYISAISTIIVTASQILKISKTLTSQTIINHPGVIQAGVMIIVAIALTLICEVLGIVGLALKNRKKVFALLGVIIGAIPPVFILVLFYIRTSQF